MFYWKYHVFLGYKLSYDKVLIFQWHHIEIGWVVERINSESVKVQNVLIEKLKNLSCFLESAHWHQCQSDIVSVAGVLCSLLASLGETTNLVQSASWSPQVKPMMVLEALPVPYAINSCFYSRDIIGWDLQAWGWSWHLVLLVLPGAGMWVCWDWGHWWCTVKTARSMPASIISSPELNHHSADHMQAGGNFMVGQCCLLLVHCIEKTLASTGDYLLAPPFREDSWASDERSLFTVLSKWKSF